MAWALAGQLLGRNAICSQGYPVSSSRLQDIFITPASMPCQGSLESCIDNLDLQLSLWTAKLVRSLKSLCMQG